VSAARGGGRPNQIPRSWVRALQEAASLPKPLGGHGDVQPRFERAWQGRGGLSIATRRSAKPACPAAMRGAGGAALGGEQSANFLSHGSTAMKRRWPLTACRVASLIMGGRVPAEWMESSFRPYPAGWSMFIRPLERRKHLQQSEPLAGMEQAEASMAGSGRVAGGAAHRTLLRVHGRGAEQGPGMDHWFVPSAACPVRAQTTPESAGC